MKNEKLNQLLKMAEKYGADATMEMAGKDAIANDDTGLSTGSDVADMINKGTQRIIDGKDRPDQSGHCFVADAETGNLQ